MAANYDLLRTGGAGLPFHIFRLSDFPSCTRDTILQLQFRTAVSLATKECQMSLWKWLGLA